LAYKEVEGTKTEEMLFGPFTKIYEERLRRFSSYSTFFVRMSDDAIIGAFVLWRNTSTSEVLVFLL
jgi:hypothetical protein